MPSHLGLVVARPGLVRDGLQAVLSAVPGVHALEPADCVASVMERLENQTICLTILDSSLADNELCTTLGMIKEKWPQVWCIVIAGSPRQGRALQTAGTDAVLVEGFAPPLLSKMIREVIDAADLSLAVTDEQNERHQDKPRTEKIDASI
jgi:DNA-binding NarL/FixJ family response regulator